MYARINTFEGSAGRFPEIIREIKELVIPGLRDVEGFKGLVNLLDHETGSSVTITFWDSEKAMDESEWESAMIRIQATLPKGENLVGVQRCEVGELFIKPEAT